MRCINCGGELEEIGIDVYKCKDCGMIFVLS